MHELIEVLITTLDARDPYTFEHSWRVAELSEVIAREMMIGKEWIQLIHVAAHLHDIGKIGVPDFVLNKIGKLSNSEYSLMQSHSRIGSNIVKKIPMLSDISDYILCHHEQWCGRGYPEGISEKDIPLGARIISVCDSFDAMTSSRTYRCCVSCEEAFKEIKSCSGTQFCPEVIECFMDIKEKIPNILISLNDNICHSAFHKQESSLHTRNVLPD